MHLLECLFLKSAVEDVTQLKFLYITGANAKLYSYYRKQFGNYS